MRPREEIDKHLNRVSQVSLENRRTRSEELQRLKVEALFDLRDLLKNLLTKGTIWRRNDIVPADRIGRTKRESYSKYDPMFSNIPEGSAWMIEDKTFATSVYQALLRRKKFGAYPNLVGRHKGEILYIIHPKKEDLDKK